MYTDIHITSVFIHIILNDHITSRCFAVSNQFCPKQLFSKLFHSIPHPWVPWLVTHPPFENSPTGWVQPDHLRLEKYSGSKASKSAGMTWTWESWGVEWLEWVPQSCVLPIDFTQKMTFSYRGYNSRLSIYKTSYRGYNSTSLVGALVLYDYNVMYNFKNTINGETPGFPENRRDREVAY